MAAFDPRILSTVLALPDFWAGLSAACAGMGLGMLLRFAVIQRQRTSLRLAASLWEWARLRDTEQAGAAAATPLSHARRIQRYYRMMRRYRHPERSMAGGLCLVSLAVLVLSLSVVLNQAVVVWIPYLRAVPLFLALAVLTLFRPWLAALVLALLLGLTALTPLALGDGHFLAIQPGQPGKPSLSVASLTLEGMPGVRDGGWLVATGAQGAGTLRLPWAAPYPPVRIRVETRQVFWPLGLGLADQVAWRLAGLDGPADTAGPAGPPVLAGFLVRSSRMLGQAVPTAEMAGKRFDLCLMYHGDGLVLYVRPSPADN